MSTPTIPFCILPVSMRAIVLRCSLSLIFVYDILQEFFVNCGGKELLVSNVSDFFRILTMVC